MNKNAKKWVEALRSGRFSQIRNKLEDKDGNCCLGVACRLYKEAGFKLRVRTSSGGVKVFNNERSYLPKVVTNWLGLRCIDGQIINQPSLTRLNDEGESFAEIADIIESEPDGLFVK